jgi:hypothetical protein
MYRYMIRCARSRRQIEVTLYTVQPPNPLSLYVQPDDGLLETETCNWLAFVYHHLLYIEGVPGGMCQNSGECSLC